MRTSVLTLTFLCAGLLCGAEKLSVRLDRDDGIYRTGDSVRCRITASDNGKKVREFKIKYRSLFEKSPVSEKTLETKNGVIIVDEKGVRPGWLSFDCELVEIGGRAPSKKTTAGAGAIFDPSMILPLDSFPKDFDEFWKRNLSDLRKVPLKTVLEPVDLPAEYKGKVQCYAVKVDCAGKEPVTGYLAVPVGVGNRKLPVMVDFLSHVWNDTSKTRTADAAMKGIIAFFVTWHGLPVNKPEEFYREKSRTDFRGYESRGLDSPDTWYFRDMFLRVVRALEYAKSRPEWNGKDLLVRGGSLGGAQAIVAAAFDPAVSVAVVSVPAFCDFNSMAAGRDMTFPFQTAGGKELLKKNPKAGGTIAYFDAVNLAKRIQCEIYVCTGFTDTTCPPSNVIAFYNSIPADTPKYLSTNPYTGHGGTTPNTKGDQRLSRFFDGLKVY